MSGKMQLGSRDKLTVKMSRDGAVEKNLSQNTSRRISRREEETELKTAKADEKQVSVQKPVSQAGTRFQMYQKKFTKEEAGAAANPDSGDFSEGRETDPADIAMPEGMKVSTLSKTGLGGKGAERDSFRRTRKKMQQRFKEEQTKKKSTRLKFDDKPGRSASGEGKPVFRFPEPVSNGRIHAAAAGAVHSKVDQESEDNSAVEAAHEAELLAEDSAGKLKQSVKHHAATNRRSHPRMKVRKEENGKVSSLYFDRNTDLADTAKTPAANTRMYQKRRYKTAYAGRRKRGSVVFPGRPSVDTAISKASETAGDRLKRKVQSIAGKNRWSLALLIMGAAVILMVWNGIGTIGMITAGSSNSFMESSYLTTDDEIYAAENYYAGLEAVLQRQIDHIETDYPGYAAYRFQVDEISHNPYALISYLTVRYGNFKMEDVKEELDILFQKQYHMCVESGTKENEETGVIQVLNVTMTNTGLDTEIRNRLNDTEAIGWYSMLNRSYGNREYLWDTVVSQGYIQNGMSYEVPPEALQDEQFRRMITEADKYLGYPYVWGGSSPSTSFDCSGFVSWVINHCGNGWNIGRLGAEGLRRICTYVPPDQAKPGDLIFFQGTYDTTGASHVGIYAGNGMMIHCGNPIQYASIEINYWQQHFYCFGRLPNG